MFPFFKKENNSSTHTDVKTIREAVLSFVKDQLAKAEGGEGGHIRGMQLFLASPPEEKHLYEAAMFVSEEDRFKEEVQKIADDYALNLPPGWTMEITFADDLPPQAVRAASVQAALFIKTGRQVLHKKAEAYIQVLTGTAEKEAYVISSEQKKICIGREKKVQTSSGFYRINQIAFPADSGDEANKFISRQHAHIEWDEESGTFLLFADEGGVPPRNKVKVRSADGDVVKLQTDKVGHQLQEGDQIMLGDGALLGFSYQKEI